MRKQSIENAAFDVAFQVRAVEDSIATAIAEIAELQSKMIRAETVTKVGVSNSQAAFARMADALQALVAARGGIGGCHAALVEAKQFIPGLRTTAFGDGDECPEKKSFTELRVVA